MKILKATNNDIKCTICGGTCNSNYISIPKVESIISKNDTNDTINVHPDCLDLMYSDVMDIIFMMNIKKDK